MFYRRQGVRSRPPLTTGSTGNAVVVAVTGGALRRYLGRRRERPDSPLLAMVPVSTRNMLRVGCGCSWRDRLMAPSRRLGSNLIRETAPAI
jgi:hypothetical protein